MTVGREGIQIRQRVAPSDQARQRLLDALRSDPVFEGKLVAWVEEKGLSISPTSLLYGSLYESVRRVAANELLPSEETSDERG